MDIVMEERELKAMISLLDDRDDVVFKLVEQNLLKMGIGVIPQLESAWESSLNELLHQRIESVIQKIQFTNTKDNLVSWNENGCKNIIEGAFWIAKYQYPDLSLEDVLNQIDKIATDIIDEMPDETTNLAKIHVINHILYDINLLSGNNANFSAPQNSYINHVLETRKGNPVTLAMCYIYVAQKAGLPVYGVNLPKNFILAFTKEKNSALPNEIRQEDVLFYINPYNRGAVLGKREIDLFITQQKIKHSDTFYLPCSNRIAVQRLILNLIYSYDKLGYPNKIEDLHKLEKLFKPPLPDDIPY